MTQKLKGYMMLMGLVLLVLGVQPAAAAFCKVPSGPHPSIQTAVNDAACTTIHVAAGTFTENVVLNRDVTIRGAGQDNTIVDGADNGNVFLINSGTVTIQGITIQHGRGSGLPPTDNGGGILMLPGVTLTIKNSTLSDNDAPGSGGGILNISGALTVQNCTFIGNRAPGGGGISNNNGPLTIRNSTFIRNNAGGFGGAIGNFSGTVIVRNSILFENTARFGSGIFNQDTLRVQNSTLSNNQAVVDGGGIENSGTATIRNSIIVNNSVGRDGGGILNPTGSTVTVQNSTIADNSAGTDGGGIFNTGTATLKHVTFEDNTPNDCTGCL